MRTAAISALLLTCLAYAQTTPPDPVELMRRSTAAQKDNSVKVRQYTFHEYKVNRELDKDGKETGRETETWEVMGLEGSWYRKLVTQNDKPLPPKVQKREDDRLRQEAERRKRETPDERKKRLLSFSYSFIFPYARAADIYDLQFRGEETVRGRRAYRVEGSPKPGFHPATDDEKEALNYQMNVWLDAEDLCFARVEMEVVGDHSRVKRGSLIQQDSARNEDGVWLPTAIAFRYNVRFFKMIGGRGEHTTTYSDYRKFQVDSRILDASGK
jgi:hypothetical protein